MSSDPLRGGWRFAEGQGRKRKLDAQFAQVQSWLRQHDSFVHHFGVVSKVYLDFSFRFFKISLTKQTFIIPCFADIVLGTWGTNKEIKPYSLSG